jgi:hypothetical protein
MTDTVALECKKCTNTIGPVRNFWDKLGKGHFSPIDLPSPSHFYGLQPAGEIRIAAVNTVLEGSYLQDLQCKECQEVLGLRCEDAPPGHILHVGQVILRLNRMVVTDLRTNEIAEPKIRHTFDLGTNNKPKATKPPAQNEEYAFSDDGEHLEAPPNADQIMNDLTPPPQEPPPDFDFGTWAVQSIQKQNESVARMELVVNRLDEEMKSFKEFMVTMRKELSARPSAVEWSDLKEEIGQLSDAVEETQNQVAAGAGSVNVNEEEMEIITESVTRLWEKSSEIDSVKLELQFLRARVKRLEDAATGQPSRAGTPLLSRQPLVPAFDRVGSSVPEPTAKRPRLSSVQPFGTPVFRTTPLPRITNGTALSTSSNMNINGVVHKPSRLSNAHAVDEPSHPARVAGPAARVRAELEPEPEAEPRTEEEPESAPEAEPEWELQNAPLAVQEAMRKWRQGAIRSMRQAAFAAGIPVTTFSRYAKGRIPAKFRGGDAEDEAVEDEENDHDEDAENVDPEILLDDADDGDDDEPIRPRRGRPPGFRPRKKKGGRGRPRKSYGGAEAPKEADVQEVSASAPVSPAPATKRRERIERRTTPTKGGTTTIASSRPRRAISPPPTYNILALTKTRKKHDDVLNTSQPPQPQAARPPRQAPSTPYEAAQLPRTAQEIQYMPPAQLYPVANYNPQQLHTSRRYPFQPQPSLQLPQRQAPLSNDNTPSNGTTTNAVNANLKRKRDHLRFDEYGFPLTLDGKGRNMKYMTEEMKQRLVEVEAMEASKGIRVPRAGEEDSVEREAEGQSGKLQGGHGDNGVEVQVVLENQAGTANQYAIPIPDDSEDDELLSPDQRRPVYGQPLTKPSLAPDVEALEAQPPSPARQRQQRPLSMQAPNIPPAPAQLPPWNGTGAGRSASVVASGRAGSVVNGNGAVQDDEGRQRMLDAREALVRQTLEREMSVLR